MLNLSFILVCYFTQTLITLNLNGNQIGEKGAQYIGAALQKNTVRKESHTVKKP